MKYDTGFCASRGAIVPAGTVGLTLNSVAGTRASVESTARTDDECATRITGSLHGTARRDSGWRDTPAFRRFTIFRDDPGELRAPRTEWNSGSRAIPSYSPIDELISRWERAGWTRNGSVRWDLGALLSISDKRDESRIEISLLGRSPCSSSFFNFFFFFRFTASFLLAPVPFCSSFIPRSCSTWLSNERAPSVDCVPFETSPGYELCRDRARGTSRLPRGVSTRRSSSSSSLQSLQPSRRRGGPLIPLSMGIASVPAGST